MGKESYNEVNSLLNKRKMLKARGLSIKYWFYRLKWFWIPRLKLVTRFPIHLDIESTNFCNLKCTMCPHSQSQNLNGGFIDLGLAKKIIDEAAENGLSSLKLNWRGEPLLHPHLSKMIKYAKQKGVTETLLNTNGLLLDEQKSNELMEAGLDYIIFSMDGATKETYERIRVGADYYKLLRNINHLIKIRKSKKRKFPLIRIQMVKMKDTVGEVNDFIQMWKDKVDFLAVNDYSRRVNEQDRSVSGKVAVDRDCCPHPWRRLAISWDGKVLMCCGDWSLKTVLGDVARESLKDIWHSNKFNRIRSLLVKNRLDEIPACKDCFVLASYKWKKIKRSCQNA